LLISVCYGVQIDRYILNSIFVLYSSSEWQKNRFALKLSPRIIVEISAFQAKMHLV